MSDAQLHILLTHLKARLDDAIDIAEETLPEDLKVTPEISELVKKFSPLLSPPKPYFPPLVALYALQSSLADDLDRLDKAIQAKPDLRHIGSH